MKKYLFYAASALAVVGCSNDDYLGNNDGNNNGQNASNAAISFAGGAGKITRADVQGPDAVKLLNGQFKVYGVKSGTTEGSALSKVFVDYSVWDNTNHTTSNSSNWEYVGANGASNLGTSNISLSKDQTIKYWDYSAADYRFVAGSPIDKFTFNKGDNTEAIASATVTGLNGHINANNVGNDDNTETKAADLVYAAEPIIVKKSSDYKQPVKFTFHRLNARVRVGIYETIPGYKIKSINFYAYNNEETPTLTVETGNNIVLTSATTDYFIGGSNQEGKITYNWDATGGPTASLEIQNADTKSQNWYAGKLKDGVQATTGAETEIEKLYGTDKEMDSKTGYFTVLPTQAQAAAPLIIKCDYVLESLDNSGEKIKVTGATAAIPAEFSKWESNTLYTYIFKISDNTNGTTGGDTDPEGLYPITFDAAVAQPEVGTTTTFSAPSITTYQDGSVNVNAITYKAGEIKIYVCKQDDGQKQELYVNGDNTNIAVYKLTKKRTEADLQVSTISKTEITDNTTGKQDVTVTENVGSFTAAAPSNSPDYYVIQYKSTAGDKTVYTYKVVEVAAASTGE